MKIFISYRRSDTPHEAQRIRQRLQQQFGEQSVFIDRKIPPGEEFDKYLEAELKSCDALVAVMGKDFFRTKQSKISEHEDPDYVRWEIETALQMEIPVFPIIVGKEKMPREKDLPERLKAYAKRQALHAIEPGFDSAIDELVNALKTIQLISRQDSDAAIPVPPKIESATMPLAIVQLASWKSVLTFIGCILISGICIDYLRAERGLTVERLPDYFLLGSTYLSVTLLVILGPLLFYKLVSVLRARLYMPVGDRLSVLFTASGYMCWVSGFLVLALATNPKATFHFFEFELAVWLLLVPGTLLGLICASLVALEMNLRAVRTESVLMTLLPWFHLANLSAQASLIYLVLASAIAARPDIASSLMLFLLSSVIASIVVGYWYGYWGGIFKKEGATSHFVLSVLVMLGWIVVSLSSFSHSFAKIIF